MIMVMMLTAASEPKKNGYAIRLRQGNIDIVIFVVFLWPVSLVRWLVGYIAVFRYCIIRSDFICARCI